MRDGKDYERLWKTESLTTTSLKLGHDLQSKHQKREVGNDLVDPLREALWDVEEELGRWGILGH